DLAAGTVDLTVWAGGHSHRVARAGVIDASGPLATLGGNVLVTDTATAAALAGKPGRVTRIDVVVEPGTDREQVREGIRRELGDSADGPVQAEVHLPRDNDRSVQEALIGIKISFYLCGGGALVVGMFL